MPISGKSANKRQSTLKNTQTTSFIYFPFAILTAFSIFLSKIFIDDRVLIDPFLSEYLLIKKTKADLINSHSSSSAVKAQASQSPQVVYFSSWQKHFFIT